PGAGGRVVRGDRPRDRAELLGEDLPHAVGGGLAGDRGAHERHQGVVALWIVRIQTFMAAVGDRRDNRTDLRGRAMARWAVVSLVVALSITSAAPVQAAAKKKVYARYVTDSSPFGQHPDEPLQGPWRLGLQDGRLIRLDDAVFASYRSEPALTPHGSQVAYYRRVRRRRRPRASPPTGRSRPWPPWRTRRASDPGPAPASARFWPQHGSGLSTVPASVWFRPRCGSGFSAV